MKGGQQGRPFVLYGDFAMRAYHSALHYKRNPPKMFDHPYITTISAQNGGWVRYQLLPMHLHGHRVNPVQHRVFVNIDEEGNPIFVWVPTNHFHCVHCKIMGTETTLQEYSCVKKENKRLMGYTRESYTPTEEDFDKYSHIRTKEGWWYREALQNRESLYYLEKKWKLRRS
jgi:hypothetical protein